MSKKYQVLGSLASQFGAIPSPTKAVEGQMLIVKAVDENGKPIEWEVITPPEGFSGNYNDLTNVPADLAKIGDIPTLLSQLTNDSGYALEKNVDPAGTAKSKVSEHNVNTDAHNDIRLLIEGLTNRLNAIANSDDPLLDQLAEVVGYIKANRSLIESITTAKINVSDIIDNLTTNVSNKPVSAAQAVVLKGLIDALESSLNSHTANTSNPHNVTAAQVGAYSKSETDTKLDTKANKSDIATTKYVGLSNSTVAYVKISDFGAWGAGSWAEKGFSMLISSRAGETIWVSVSSDDSNTNARAFRLMNTYGKIVNLYYSVSESAIYVKANAWCNNITAHLLSNIKGDYVPTVESASALASDAVEINIVEFGVTSTSAVVGDSSVKLEMGGSEDRPTYNGKNMALDTIVTVDVTSGAKSLTFTADNSNNEWRYVYASGITSLTLASSGTFANTAEAYYSVVFLSGTTATTITNTLGAYFTGDDCLDGSFNPMSSKTYDVGIWWNGVKWQAVVRGV